MNTTEQKATLLNPSVRHLAMTMLETSTDDFGTPLDKVYGPRDIEQDSLTRIYCDFQRFVDVVEGRVTEVVGGDWESLEDFFIEASPFRDGSVERYFIFTRNREGEGYWNTGRWDERVSKVLTDAAHSFPEITCCLCDDGQIEFF